MKSKKGMELTINAVILFVIALVVLAVGIYIIYSKILKPSESTTSILNCESRGGEIVSSCSGQVCAVCIDLPNKNSKDPQPCCIKAIT
jgi:hypothetical protein